MLDSILASDLVWRLGWTLLHSLWQLVVLGVITSLALALLWRQSANTRYWVACCGLALFYAPLVATFVLIPPRPIENVEAVAELEEAAATNAGGSSDPTITTATTPAYQPAPTPPQPTVVTTPNESKPTSAEPDKQTTAPIAASAAETTIPWLPLVVGVWAIVVGLLSLWNLGGWFVVHRLTQTAALPASDSATLRLQQLARQMGITQTIRLLESLQIDSPMVIGWLRPVVLLPPSLLTSLTATELDAVLAHELAHIRRYDYLVNLLQTLTETLLFFHPAVWLLSRYIRTEREYCCDDEAVSICGSKTNYARALAAVEANRPVPQLAMPFIGSNRNMTLNRVRRIMGLPVGLPNAWLNGGGVLLLAAMALTAVALTQSEGTAAPETANNSGEAVEGFETTLRTSKTKWSADETIVLHCDLRNRGERELLATLAMQPCEIEFDGKWYKWSGGYSLRATALSPGEEHKNVRIALVNHWKNRDAALPLTPGKHTVRAALVARSPKPKAPDALPPVRAVSNPVEIEIVEDKSPRLGWGEEKDGLKTRLTAASNVFRAGHSVSLALEVTNSGTVAKEYGRISANSSDNFEVLDESGNPVAYIAGPAQVVEREATILPGQTQVVAVFDLADSYFLRKPGGYTVKLRKLLGDSLPPSGEFRFEVTPDRAAVNDPVAALLPLQKKDWLFIASSEAHNRQPGANWQAVNCSTATFRLLPPTSKRDFDFVSLYLADEAAKKQPEDLAIESSAPATEYLGKLSRWHVYFLASEGALKAWPTARDDISKALIAVEASRTGGQQRQPFDPIDAHEKRLNASRGLWVNGIYPDVALHEYATVKQVLNLAITRHGFDEGDISSFRILKHRPLELEPMMTGYRAALIETNLGPKIFMFRYERDQQWWTRFYDIATAETPIDEEPAESSPEKSSAIDPKSFRLDFEYQGPSDKPFYNACLHIGEAAEEAGPFQIVEPLDEFRAERVFAWLKRSGFFDRAKEKADSPAKPDVQRYVMRVASGDHVYEEDLGWGLPMLLRMSSFDLVFDEQPEDSLVDVQAISPLDPLVSRLGGYRMAWLGGRVVDDLQYKLVAEKQFVKAGEPINITLSVTNTGDEEREYSPSPVSFDDAPIVAYDEFGRSVPYVGGPSQKPYDKAKLGAGETAVIETFDLAAFRYLRRPGIVTVAFEGKGESRSNHVSVHITPGSTDDGDLIGRLLTLVHGSWVLVGNPNLKGMVRPGDNFERVRGQQIVFQDNPAGSKADSAVITLWFTDKKAEPREALTDEPGAELSEYVGKVDRWHLYAHFDKPGRKRWPEILKDVRRTLTAAVDDPAETSPDESRAELRRSVADADLVVVGKIVDRPLRSIDKDVAYYISNVEIGEVLKGEKRFAGASLLMSLGRFEPEESADLPPIEKGAEFVLFVKSLGVGVKPNFTTANQKTSIRRKTPELVEAVLSIVSETSRVGDDFYRSLHDRYKSLVAKAAMSGEKDEVARLTDQFNKSIGGRLAYVQVTPRKGPIEKHEVLFSRFYADEKITFGKISHRPATRPHVWRTTTTNDATEFVFIETNRTINLGLVEPPWPDDLQIQLVVAPMDDKVITIDDRPDLVYFSAIVANASPVAWLTIRGERERTIHLLKGQIIWTGKQLATVDDIQHDRVVLSFNRQAVKWKLSENLAVPLGELNDKAD